MFKSEVMYPHVTSLSVDQDFQTGSDAKTNIFDISLVFISNELDKETCDLRKQTIE